MEHTRKLTTGLSAVATTAGMAGRGGNNAGSTASAFSTPASSAAETTKSLTGDGSGIMYITTSSYSSPFSKTKVESASVKAKELGYEVKAVSYDDDTTKQAELPDNAIADKAAVIIYDNIGADATVATVERAHDNNIPTFLIDREINELGVVIPQIVANNYQGAKAITERFVEAMDEKGEYAELLGKESDTDVGMRSNVFHEITDQYPNMEMVTQQTTNWEQTEVYQKVETTLRSNPNIEGIVCGNDIMTVSVTATIKAAGLKGIAIVDVDGSDEAAGQIKSGNMAGTVPQQVALTAEMDAEQADQYLKTGSTGKDERQLVDYIAITKDNVNKLKNFVHPG